MVVTLKEIYFQLRGLASIFGTILSNSQNVFCVILFTNNGFLYFSLSWPACTSLRKVCFLKESLDFLSLHLLISPVSLFSYLLQWPTSPTAWGCKYTCFIPSHFPYFEFLQGIKVHPLLKIPHAPLLLGWALASHLPSLCLSFEVGMDML